MAHSMPNGNSHSFHEPVAQYSEEEQSRGIRDSFFNNYWEVHINEPSMLNLIQMYGVK